MNWPMSLANVDNGWVISPSDCYLVKNRIERKHCGSVRRKVENASKKKQYHWEIRLETILPKRTTRKHK